MEIDGSRLKDLREKMGLTFSDLAKFLDISSDDVSKLENNQKNLDLTMIHKLSNLYCCDEKYLVGLTDEYEPIFHSFDSNKISVNDLNAIAKINQIYKNSKYLIKKQKELRY